MKKVFNIIIKYWYISLLVIPVYFIFIHNLNLNPDLWFILNTGGYITEHGFFNIDPFTIHEGLSFCIQQWLVDIVFYYVHFFLGSKGLLIVIYLSSILLGFILYKYFYLLSNNKKLSFIFSTICIALIGYNLITRPQLYDYIILILESYLLEKYIKTKNKKNLYPLPFLSLLFINIHASTWWFQYVFILPFIVNGLKIKKINKDKYELKPILIITLLMFIAGFINPYTYKLVIYLFKSYGMKEINKYITEMKRPLFDEIYFKVVIALFAIILFLINYFRNKLNTRYIFLFIGNLILYLMHQRCYAFFIMYSFCCICILLKKVKFDFIELKNKYILLFINCIKINMIIIFIIVTSYILYLNFKSVTIHSSLEPIGEYLEQHATSQIKLFTDYDQGQYFEYLGYKVYIDSRAELFYKKMNGKEDIFTEAVAVYTDMNYDYESFIKKYDFDYMVINPKRYIYKYLKEHYDEVKTVYIDDEPYYSLFKIK